MFRQLSIIGFLILYILIPIDAQNSTSTIVPEINSSTIKQNEEVPVAEVTTAAASTSSQIRYPCKCTDGVCSCCLGNALQNFNINFRQKFCSDIQYFPEDFEFQLKVRFNDRVLYQNRVSGKNPRPICLPVSRYLPIRVCARFNNIYTIGRNLHACLDMEGIWYEDTELFKVSFECFRIGTDGIAFLRPEEGGGISSVLPNTPNEDEDYDDNV